MNHLVASPALPTMGLEPRYWRKRRLPAEIVEEPEMPLPVAFDEFDAGPGVDEVTGELRQRVLEAKPLTPKRLPAYLAMSIAAGLTALGFELP